MYAKSAALASAVAMAASVVAVEHPRIYFPREIKREYHNSTITSPESSSSTPDVTTTTDSSTTKRDLLSDLISEILGTEWPPKSSTSEKPKPPVTTVIVDSTVVVGGPSSGSGLPKVTVLPTTKKTESKKKPGTRTRSSTGSGIVIGPTGIVSSSPSSEPTKITSVDPPVGNSTAAESTTTSTGGGILDPIGTLLSSLLPIPEPTSKSKSTSSPEQPISQNSTTSDAPTTSETKTGLLPPLTSLLPIGGSTTTTSDYGSLPNATSTDVPVTTTTSSGPAITNVPTTTTDIPVGNTTSTTTGTISTPTVTDIPVTNGTVSVPPTGTATTSTTSGDNSTVIVVPSTTSQPTLIPTTTSQTVTPTTTDAGVTSIRPTATLTNTNNWLPTTIVIEPTTFSFSSPTASPTETTSQGLPTTIPKVINPDNPTKPAPSGTVPIQIGFTWQLNYMFVASNPTAASQIFQLLPRALSDASGVSVDKMQIYGLVPFNTQANWGYITTIANLSYPATLVDTLQMDLWTPNSAVYNNADPMVRNLTSFINIQIDLHGNINSGGAPGSGGSGGNSGNNNNNNDAFGSGNNQGDQNSKQKATTAGIAVAAVGLSAAYGAAMFIVARRYKRKRQGHRRASSITSGQASPEMRYHGNGSPALMGGALMSRDTSTYGGAGGRDSHASGGHSARTAGISAPVATENSLGWN